MNYTAVNEAIRSGEPYQTVPTLCRLALTEIVDGRRELRGVRHPLGFLCLPLYRDGAQGVCVHIWSASFTPAEATTSQIHSHSWDLVSYVLYGQVGNVLLHVVDDPAGGTYRVFEIHSHGDVDEIRATPRRVRSVTAGHEATGPGSTYHLSAGRFHASVVEDGLEAATVAIGRMGTALDLSLGRIDTPTHWVARVRCGPEETVEAARMVLTSLADQPVRRDGVR
jgi:hypothetical protein